MEVYKCPYCNATCSRDGKPFTVFLKGKARIKLHIAVAHPEENQSVEPEVVEEGL